MQTTLDIDLDVLSAAEALAAKSKRTAGQVISDLVRKGLRSIAQGSSQPTVINGFEVIPAGDRVVTRELVQQLLEDTEAA
jgi:hypothetical protein